MSIIQAFPAGAGGGTSDYTDLENKPQIAGVILSGNKTLSELGIQPAEAGKGLSTEDYTTAEKTKLDNIDLSNYVPNSEVGSAGGVAELDANGKVPVSQMPNGFDNIDNGTAGEVTSTVNGYTAESFTRTGESSPVTPADDTLYVDTTLNVAFRWTGSQYISVGGGGVALGETSSTAYRGDRGKIAYDDSQVNKSAIGTLSNLNTTEKTNLVGAINEVRGVATSKEDRFRYTTMPEASVDYVGQVVQYIGISTIDYTQGNSYKCVLDGSTYKWVAFGGVKDNRIGDEITNIKVRFDDGYRPYITIDQSKIIGSFDEMSLDEIMIIVDLYYSGGVSLETIQEHWNIGDTKTIHINEIDTIAEQDVTMMVVDFTHDDLTTSQNGKTKALMTLAFMLNENTSWSSAYSSSALNTWLNGTGLDMFPTDIKNKLKSVSKSVDGGFPSRYNAGTTTTINAKVFLPTCREVIGRDITNAEISGGANYFKTGGGTRYELHKTLTRSKNILTSAGWAKSTNAPNWYTGQVGCTPANAAFCAGDSGFMPHFCI